MADEQERIRIRRRRVKRVNTSNWIRLNVTVERAVSDRLAREADAAGVAKTDYITALLGKFGKQVDVPDDLEARIDSLARRQDKPYLEMLIQCLKIGINKLENPLL